MAFLLPFLPSILNILDTLFLNNGSQAQNHNLEAIEKQLELERQAKERAQKQAEKAERARIQAEKARDEAERMRKIEDEVARRLAMEKAQVASEQNKKGVLDTEKEKEALENARLARRKAEADAERARVEQERAEKEAAEGTKKARNDDVVWPTAEEYTRTLKARQYEEGKYHFAIVGQSGSGKSSLINAFRGNSNQTSAPTNRTTIEIGRYPDSDPKRPFVWYEIPSASSNGTLTVGEKDWEYFNKQGLYIFDAIIILSDGTKHFTSTDIGILRNCARWKIPTFIVCSKSDQRIETIKSASQGSSPNERKSWMKLTGTMSLESAVEEYKSKTCQITKDSLKEAGFGEDKDVYLVSSNALLSIINRKSMVSKGFGGGQVYLDEAKLFSELVQAAYKRRCPPGQELPSQVDSPAVATATSPNTNTDTVDQSKTTATNTFGRWTNTVGLKQMGGKQN
ncbi:hypothetical protein VKT23_013438 [Stygiomarasmius scandens]|uniref:IRG-type G domain-containing protein n=1 Tax=Marasmiellus scandens TaxID=2682957 RepID=A0ABR1J827_9AGAR